MARYFSSRRIRSAKLDVTQRRGVSIGGGHKTTMDDRQWRSEWRGKCYLKIVFFFVFVYDHEMFELRYGAQIY